MTEITYEIPIAIVGFAMLVAKFALQQESGRVLEKDPSALAFLKAVMIFAVWAGKFGSALISLAFLSGIIKLGISFI